MRGYLLLVIFLTTGLVSAQNIPGLPPTLFPSVVVPANPNTNDEIFLDVTMERCISFAGNVLDFVPTVANGIVTVQLPGGVAIDSMFCSFPRRTVRLALGRIPQGSYTLEFRLRIGFTPITELGLIVQRTPLVVGPAPFTVEQVSGARPIGLAFLALSLVLLGGVFVRRVG